MTRWLFELNTLPALKSVDNLDTGQWDRKTMLISIFSYLKSLNLYSVVYHTNFVQFGWSICVHKI